MTTLRRFARYLGWPFVMLLVGAIKLYKLAISPLLGPKCKFYPTCSTYAIDALLQHGLFKGTVLATYRIGRCHPWQLGGLDPVPAKGAWRPDINPDGSPRSGVELDRQLTDFGV